MYKIIFFDLDGTLLNDNKEILIENIQALQIAKENGIEIVLCSGRQKDFVEKYRKIAGTGDYIISSNGAEIYYCKNDDEIFNCEVDEELCKELYCLAAQRDFFVKIDTRYARYLNDIKYLWLRDPGAIEIDEDIEEFLKKNKVLQFSIGAETEHEIDEIEKYVEKNPYVKMENKFLVKKDGKQIWLINIVNKSVSKGNAISGLCKYLKIDLKDAVAFGDDMNDISMLQTVGLGVAMENALPEIKEIANKIIGNNNRPSIAECIYEIIENNRK